MIKNTLIGTIQPLVGEKGDILDNQLFEGLSKVTQIEQQLREIWMLGPDEYGNTIIQDPEARIFDWQGMYNESQLNDLASCTSNGGTWLEGIGCSYSTPTPPSPGVRSFKDDATMY